MDIHCFLGRSRITSNDEDSGISMGTNSPVSDRSTVQQEASTTMPPKPVKQEDKELQRALKQIEKLKTQKRAKTDLCKQLQDEIKILKKEAKAARSAEAERNHAKDLETLQNEFQKEKTLLNDRISKANSEVQELKQERNILRRQVDMAPTCTICLDAKCDVVFLPCLHNVTCSVCANGTGTRQVDICPTCRQKIRAKLPMYN
ncbi:hypothetical protein L596_028311 [Steinernema carpocapsae]|uniref:RING-type domain-containing protein n=1 Tax=Steinernema carpocapsae TaxID=34508 RepID=A0A4U5LY39_STECR|nr:hypothetical protein L596_028311 [Steinernema carpocapsae]